MPNAGLLDLVAHGVQDIYLIGNPEITFFKVVFKRHTNFSMESIRATYNGNANFGEKIIVPLPRSGDLVHSLILEIVEGTSNIDPVNLNGVSLSIVVIEVSKVLPTY